MKTNIYKFALRKKKLSIKKEKIMIGLFTIVNTKSYKMEKTILNKVVIQHKHMETNSL